MKKGPLVVCWVYVGDEILPKYVGIIINHEIRIPGSLLNNQYNPESFPSQKRKTFSFLFKGGRSPDSMNDTFGVQVSETRCDAEPTRWVTLAEGSMSQASRSCWMRRFGRQQISNFSETQFDKTPRIFM